MTYVLEQPSVYWNNRGVIEQPWCNRTAGWYNETLITGTVFASRALYVSLLSCATLSCATLSCIARDGMNPPQSVAVCLSPSAGEPEIHGAIGIV